jgi:radical SAM superfamily enzyme YgiQ (UPF0313 family)
VTQYTLVDDLYNDSKEKVRRLYDEVWSRLPFEIEWGSHMRLDMIYSDPESAEWIKHSGAKIGSFGIETLNNRAGRSVGKGLGKQRILDTLEHLKEAWGKDVLVSAYFIAGLPYESEDSIRETMEWALNTDLLHSAIWSAMWITPPAHIDIVAESAIIPISKNANKWGVSWDPEGNWINTEGMTFKKSSEMCAATMKKMPLGAAITYTDYSDLRISGLTHDQIADLKYNPDTPKLLIDGTKTIKRMIEDRLQKILDLSD